MDTQSLHKFTLDQFKKSFEGMISANVNSQGYSIYGKEQTERVKDYTAKEIFQIITSSDLEEKRILSRNYFYKDGFYKRIILHYATLPKYIGFLIPQPSFGKDISNSALSKRYYNSLDYLENMQLSTLLTEITLRALIEGTYYGMITSINNKKISLVELPSSYCKSIYKDLNGRDLIEFNLSYFDKIEDSNRKKVLASFPKEIQKAYKKYSKTRELDLLWYQLPSNIGVCFKYLDGRPPFLDVIPATIYYDYAVENELEREKEEIKKIIVQKVPHLNDGTLLFEPPEAEEMHRGTVGMMKGNKNVSVLTTYADTDIMTSKTGSELSSNVVEKMAENVYQKTGVSGQVFTATSSSAVEISLTNDMTVVMPLLDKYSVFITEVINQVFSNKDINFKYKLLPISHYNSFKYLENALKLASSGYSFILPALSMDLTQKDIVNVKDLENNLLKLGEKLIPLSTSYTQSGDGAGAPAKEQEQKADTTLAKEDSLDNGGSIA